MDIGDVHAALLPEIRERLLLVEAGAPIGELGGILEELSCQFEALGLCHLLDAANLLQFAENLARSGHARRFFLERSRREGHTDDRRLALGRTTAVLDAIVSADLDLARAIASLSIDVWHPAWEYEDDFCFYLFIHQLLILPSPAQAASIAATLDRFERALAGAKSARLDVCRALAERERGAFVDALAMRLEDIEADVDEERTFSHVQEGDLCFWPRSFVSIEGLALLRLAELAGMSVHEELRLCPPIARGAQSPRPYRDFFREISP